MGFKILCWTSDLKEGWTRLWNCQRDLLDLLDTGKGCREVIYTVMVVEMIWTMVENAIRYIVILSSLKKKLYETLDLLQDWTALRTLDFGESRRTSDWTLEEAVAGL